jgi:hypothetical protein
MSEWEQRMDDDFHWALHSPEVMQNPGYLGKPVVVHNKRVLASGGDRHALVEQAAKASGVPSQQLLVMVVPDVEVWEIPIAGERVMQLRKMSELEQRMTEDSNWAQHAPEVMQNPEYFGKLVVVHNKRVVAAGRDRQALVQEAAKEVGVPWQHLVVIVVPDIDVWEDPL